MSLPKRFVGDPASLERYNIFRHGPKPGSHEAEAEAEAFTKLEAEAEALTLIDLEAEAEALVTKPKPKPGYLYYTYLQKKSTTRRCIILLHMLLQSKRLVCKVEALVNHEAEAEAFENHEAEAEARLSKI